MKRDMHQAVREACLWMPETDEIVSHGSPNFRVRGKSFASFVVNHHGDGRVALWLNAPNGAQQHWVAAEPRHFFVPPYLGVRGWLGVDLNRGLSWARIAGLAREAYEKVAPPRLAAELGKTPAIKAPPRLSSSDIDPLQSTRGKAFLKLLRRLCLALPEVREVTQFGCPAWQAGSKTFAWARSTEGRLMLYVRVGIEQQGLFTQDPRFSIPAYFGHNGWIALDAGAHCDAGEIEPLLLQSYRHFALKRMLRQL